MEFKSKKSENTNILISDTLANMLNVQKDSELYNHELYKRMSNFFKSKGLQKLAEYYFRRGEEEKHHHDWIVERLKECNVELIYKPKQTVEEFNDYIRPFELTVEAELKTTKSISDIVSTAMVEQDYKIAYWLMEKLISEQHEEEFLSKTILDIANQECDWLTKQDTILEFYNNVQNKQ